MSEDLNQGAPSVDTPSAESAAPQSISDFASRAIEVANERQAKREAGETVPDALPSVAPDRARDPHGKFAPKPKPSADAEPAKAAAPKPAPEAGTTSSPTPEAAAAPAALQPPARWSQDEKATFARLPQDAQKLILERDGRQEASFTQKSQEIADQRRAIEPLVAAYNEHAEFLNHRSQEIAQPPARILGDMVHLYRQGTTGQPHERSQALGFVAQLFGIDLRSLAQGQVQGQAPQEQVPPAIMRELQQLRQQQAEHARFIQTSQQDREQQSFQTLQQQIDAFRDATGSDGQLQHPYFDAVYEQMCGLARPGMDIQALYDQVSKPITDAIAAREAKELATREASEKQARETAEAADKERSAQVDRARRAGGPRPTGSRPGMTQSKDLDAIAWEAMRKTGLAG